MVDGMNVDAETSVERLILTAEHYDIPLATARVGGTQPFAVIPFVAVGLIVAGTVNPMSEDMIEAAQMTPVEISVVTDASVPASGMTLDLKAAYEQLRDQMTLEGTTFLGPDELEKEIAERKGNRA